MQFGETKYIWDENKLSIIWLHLMFLAESLDKKPLDESIYRNPIQTHCESFIQGRKTCKIMSDAKQDDFELKNTISSLY